MLHETAVLGREAKLRNVTQVLLQEHLVSSRDDPNGVLGVGRQQLQRVDEALRGHGSARLAHDRRQGTVIVKHEQTFVGRPVLGEEEGTVKQGRGIGRARVTQDVVHLADKLGDPRLDVVLGDVAVQAGLHSLTLLIRHGEGGIDLLCHAAEVPGVDVDGVTQTTGCATELGEDKRGMVLLLTHNVLQTSRVHAVTDRGDEADVARPQQRKVLILVEILGVVLDRRESKTAVHAIDAHNELVDARGHLGVVLELILVSFDAGGRGDLDEHHLFTPLGVHLEEALKRLQLLGNASNTVKAVSSDNDLLTVVKLTEGIMLFLDCRGPGEALDLGGVDANGEDADLDSSPIGIDSECVRRESENSGAAAKEVAGVAVGLKPNEVGAQDTLQHLLTTRQAAEELATRERRVQEEGDVHVGNPLSQHAGKQHEEVVVNNDNIAGLVDLDNLMGKLLVHTVVVSPLDAFSSAIGGLMLLVVEEGVEILLGIAAPPSLVLEEDAIGGNLGLVRQPDGVGADCLVVGQTVLETVLILAGNPETVNWRRCRQASGGIDRNRRGEGVERSGA